MALGRSALFWYTRGRLQKIKFRELIRDGADVRADSRGAPRRERDKGVIYEHNKYSEGLDCGPVDLLRAGGVTPLRQEGGAKLAHWVG